MNPHGFTTTWRLPNGAALTEPDAEHETIIEFDPFAKCGGASTTPGCAQDCVRFGAGWQHQSPARIVLRSSCRVLRALIHWAPDETVCFALRLQSPLDLVPGSLSCLRSPVLFHDHDPRSRLIIDYAAAWVCTVGRLQCAFATWYNSPMTQDDKQLLLDTVYDEGDDLVIGTTRIGDLAQHTFYYSIEIQRHGTVVWIHSAD